jgi:hypothetical protein
VVSVQLLLQDEGEPTTSIISLEDDAVNPAWCAGAVEQQAGAGASGAQPNPEEPLLCREDPNSLNDVTLLPMDNPILSQCRNEILDRSLNMFYELPDLHNVDLGTPPDLQLGVSSYPSDVPGASICSLIALSNLSFVLPQDLQFGSQESLGSWLDRI